MTKWHTITLATLFFLCPTKILPGGQNALNHTKSHNMNFQEFQDIVSIVIDNFEGGYYHPQMLADGRIKDQRYKNSGETMLGIDRLRGGDINDTVAGKQFWRIIDRERAALLWKWNYKGGSLLPQLKELVAEMLYPRYDTLCNRYMTPEVKAIVNSDKRLILHFAYAIWNGEGWFKKFATDCNREYKLNNVTPLAGVALHSRLNEGLKPGSKPNSLIKQGGEKMKVLFEKL